MAAKKRNPPQTQSRQPGLQTKMTPAPETIRAGYRGSGKLEGRVALITGGDSGIGPATTRASSRGSSFTSTAAAT